MKTVQEEDGDQNSSNRTESEGQEETDQAEETSRMEDAGEKHSPRMENVPAGKKQTPAGNGNRAMKGKRRGPERQRLTLGGVKKQEKSLKRKMKRKINIGIGKA